MFYQYKLSNGIQVISEPMQNRRTVALGVFVVVGSQDETRGNNGISHLVEHMLFKGTKKHSVKEIADMTARMGDDVNAFTSKECTALYGMTITEKMEELAELLGDLLADPLFDARELAKEKRIVMDEIDMYEDSPEDLVHELLQKRVWRDDALGFLISGTKSVVKKFHSGELHEFFRQHYVAENMVISVAGGYEEGQLKDCLERSFAKIGIWADKANDHNDNMEGKKTGNEIAASVKREKAKELALSVYHKEYGQAAEKTCANHTKYRQTTGGMPTGKIGSWQYAGEAARFPQYYRSFCVADKDIEQLHLNLAFPALRVDDERRFAYAVLNSAFGGSNNSWLFQQIREEAGLAYSVYSYSSAYKRAGLFHIDITVQPPSAVLVLEKAGKIVEEFSGAGLGEDELELHKQQVKTELIMSAESPKTRMDANAKFMLAGTKIYTLEEKLERIEAVDCAQIRALAKEILQLPAASLCVVGEKQNMDLRAIKKMWKGWENMG